MVIPLYNDEQITVCWYIDTHLLRKKLDIIGLFVTMATVYGLKKGEGKQLERHVFESKIEKYKIQKKFSKSYF